MNDDIKKALHAYKKARAETDNLPILGENYDACPRNVYLDDEALDKALQKEREAATAYYTLLLKDRGWTQGQIDNHLQQLGLR